MIGIHVDTEGLEGMGEELLEQTRKDLLGPVARAAQSLVDRVRQKLSVRGGPARPGDPPALDRGMIRDGIGRTGPYSEAGKVEIAWGFGVGDEARARIREHAQRRGASEGEMFAIATLHEGGGIGADGREYPPRPYIRTAEEELSAEISAELEEGLR